MGEFTALDTAEIEARHRAEAACVPRTWYARDVQALLAEIARLRTALAGVIEDNERYQAALAATPLPDGTTLDVLLDEHHYGSRTDRIAVARRLAAEIVRLRAEPAAPPWPLESLCRCGHVLRFHGRARLHMCFVGTCRGDRAASVPRCPCRAFQLASPA